MGRMTILCASKSGVENCCCAMINSLSLFFPFPLSLQNPTHTHFHLFGKMSLAYYTYWAWWSRKNTNSFAFLWARDSFLSTTKELSWDTSAFVFSCPVVCVTGISNSIVVSDSGVCDSGVCDSGVRDFLSSCDSSSSVTSSFSWDESTRVLNTTNFLLEKFIDPFTFPPLLSIVTEIWHKVRKTAGYFSRPP